MKCTKRMGMGLMALIAMLCLPALALGEAAGERPAIVTTQQGPLNMRAEPSQKARLMGRVKNGGAVTVVGEEGGWYLIRCQERQGWVMSEFITITPPAGEQTPLPGVSPLAPQEEEKLGKEWVLLRAAPDEEAQLMGWAPWDQLLVLEEKDGWSTVALEDMTGFVKTRALQRAQKMGSLEEDDPSGEEGLLEEDAGVFKEEEPEVIGKQAAMAMAFSALQDKYLLAPGWEAGFSARVQLQEPGKDEAEAGAWYRIDIFDEQGTYHGGAQVCAYTGEAVRLTWQAGEAGAE